MALETARNMKSAERQLPEENTVEGPSKNEAPQQGMIRGVPLASVSIERPKR